MLGEVKQMTTEEREETEQENNLSPLVNGTQELAALHARIAPHFRRAEVRERARRFLEGLLGRVERKNGWQLAEELGESGPQGVQRIGTRRRYETSCEPMWRNTWKMSRPS